MTLKVHPAWFLLVLMTLGMAAGVCEERPSAPQAPDPEASSPEYHPEQLLRLLATSDPMLREALPFSSKELKEQRLATKNSIDDFVVTLKIYLELFLKPEYLPKTPLKDLVVAVRIQGGDDYLFCEYVAGECHVRVRDGKYLAVFIEPIQTSIVEWSVFDKGRQPAAAIINKYARPCHAMPIFTEAVLASPEKSIARYGFTISQGQNPGALYTDGFFALFVVLKTPKYPNRIVGIPDPEWLKTDTELDPETLFTKLLSAKRTIGSADGSYVEDMFQGPDWVFPPRRKQPDAGKETH